jgi:hypothetical protein
MVLHGMMRDRL